MSYYDPDKLYGFNSLSPKQKNICTDTVVHRTRKRYTWFKRDNGLPVITSNTWEIYEVLTANAQMLRTTFPTPLHLVLLGDAQPVALATISTKGVSFNNLYILAEVLGIECQAPEIDLAQQMAEHVVDLQVGIEREVIIEPTGVVYLVKKLPNDKWYVQAEVDRHGRLAHRPDLELFLQDEATDDDLDKIEMCFHDAYAIMDFDDIVKKLPRKPAADINNILANLGNVTVATNPTPAKKKKKGKQQPKKFPPPSNAQSASASTSTQYSLPHRQLLPRYMPLAEMLALLSEKERNYKKICPSLQNYNSAFKCTPNMTIQQKRRTRDKALACAGRRQLKERGFKDKGLANQGHKKPISKAYAYATASARQIFDGPNHNDSDEALARWLLLKQALLDPANLSLVQRLTSAP